MKRCTWNQLKGDASINAEIEVTDVEDVEISDEKWTEAKTKVVERIKQKAMQH